MQGRQDDLWPAFRKSVSTVSNKPTVTSSEAEAVLKLRSSRHDEWARAKETEGVVCQTHVGGQALIEGIMMRGKYNWAVAVREPKGTIYLEEHDLASGKDKNSWLRKPVVRGCTALVESLMLGYKALDIAARHAFDFEEEDEADAVKSGDDIEVIQAAAKSSDEIDKKAARQARRLEKKQAKELAKAQANELARAQEKGSTSTQEKEPTRAQTTGPGSESSEKQSDSEDSGIPKSLMTISMILGVALGIVLFIVFPAFVTNLIVGDYAEKTLTWNLVDGVLRIAVFIFYLWLISLMKDIKRMFAYHGAEHKTIHCYEHGMELTVENARRFPTLHVRCGTAFLLMTMLIAILVFTIVPVGPFIDALGVTNTALRLVLVIISRIILLPLIAGLSYEVTVKWAGSRPDSPFVQFVLWPGMQMQRLSTNEPDDGMLECAIAAMKRVLDREKREQAAKLVKVEEPGEPATE